MQAQAYRSAKQLPYAANNCTTITGRNIHSGILASRRQLLIAANLKKSVVTNPSVLNCKWSAMFSLSRSTLVSRHFSHRTFRITHSIAYFRDNIRYFSTKRNKYCLKRRVNRHKASRLDSVKDVLSGANETVQHKAAVAHDKMLQAVFTRNGKAAPVVSKVAQQPHVAVASFSKIDKDDTVVEAKAATSKTAESYTTDIQVNSDNSILPLSRVAGPDINGAKVGAWHRISEAVRRIIPSPKWGKISFKVMPLVSRVQNNNSKQQEVEEDSQNKGVVSVTDAEHVTGISASTNVTLSSDKDLSVGTAGGFDCDTSTSNVTPEANITITAKELSPGEELHKMLSSTTELQHCMKSFHPLVSPHLSLTDYQICMKLPQKCGRKLAL